MISNIRLVDVEEKVSYRIKVNNHFTPTLDLYCLYCLSAIVARKDINSFNLFYPSCKRIDRRGLISLPDGSTVYLACCRSPILRKHSS